jgi:hypothetical protein
MLVQSVLQHCDGSAVEFTLHCFVASNAALAPNAAAPLQMCSLDVERLFGKASFNKRKNVY